MGAHRPNPMEALKRVALSGALALGLLAPGSMAASAQDLEGGTLNVGILGDMTNYDPQQFSTVNFFLIKNLYDSLIEYTEDGEAVPNLATEWSIAEDNTAVTVTLRDDVTFQSGNPFNAEAVAATLEKASDPERGKNVYATTSIIENWEAVDDTTITINFNGPVPDKQITDLLQFLVPIDPAGIDTVETEPAGTGPFKLDNRAVGQSITLTKNEDYWKEGEPILDEIVFTVFSDGSAADAALESGAIDLIYNGGSRSAVRLRDAGFQVVQGPGKLVQVFRINTTRAPFDNEKFRQAFNYLMNRPAILRLGYAGLGEPTALPWAEVYTALQTGVADGQMNPVPIISFANFAEVQQYMTLTNHLFSPYTFMISDSFWNSLTPEEQRVINYAAKSCVTASRGISRIIEASDRGLAGLMDKIEVTALTAEDRQAFKDAAQPAVLAHVEEALGAEGVALLEQFRTAVEDANNATYLKN